MSRCRLLLSTSPTASGRVFTFQFAIILLYIRTEIPQSDKTSEMPRHHDSSHTISILWVLLALLTQDASAIRWSSPRTGDVISPGDMILAAWYLFLVLPSKATVANSALVGKGRRRPTRLSFDCAPKALVVKQLVAVFWEVPSSAIGRMVGSRPYCAFACRLFDLIAYSSYRRLVPESVGAGTSYFQVELAGEVHDSPHFSVLGQSNGRRFIRLLLTSPQSLFDNPMLYRTLVRLRPVLLKNPKQRQ